MKPKIVQSLCFSSHDFMFMFFHKLSVIIDESYKKPSSPCVKIFLLINNLKPCFLWIIISDNTRNNYLLTIVEIIVSVSLNSWKVFRELIINLHLSNSFSKLSYPFFVVQKKLCRKVIIWEN